MKPIFLIEPQSMKPEAEAQPTVPSPVRNPAAKLSENTNPFANLLFRVYMNNCHFVFSWNRD